MTPAAKAENVFCLFPFSSFAFSKKYKINIHTNANGISAIKYNPVCGDIVPILYKIAITADIFLSNLKNS